MATQKQVDYALILLDKAGYSTTYMNSSFKDFGATMRERRGSVTAWLRGMTGPEISKLISRLLAEQIEGKG